MSSPIDPDVAKNEGNAAFATGNYDAAIELYSAAITALSGQSDPTDILPTLYSNRAMSHIKLAKFTDALYDCELGLANLSPDHKMFPKLTYRKAHSLFKTNQDDAAKSVYMSLMMNPTLDKATRASVDKDMQQLMKVPTPTFKQTTAPSGMTMADLQKMQQQANPQTASTQNKPLGGVWGRGGGKALSAKVSSENGNKPVHIALADPSLKKLTPVPAATQALSRDEQISQTSAQFVSYFNEKSMSLNSNPYYGEYSLSKREWRNKSMKPRQNDMQTTDYDTASENENEYMPDEDDEGTITVGRDEMKQRNAKLAEQFKQNKVKERAQQRKDRNDRITENSVYDGCLTFPRQSRTDDSAIVLCRVENGILMVGRKMKLNTQSTNVIDPAISTTTPESEEAFKSIMDCLTTTQEDENVFINQKDVEFKPFQKYKWSLPTLHAHDYLDKYHKDSIANESLSVHPSSSDLAITLINEMFINFPQIYDLINKIAINKIHGIEEYPSLQYPRRLRYIFDVQVNFINEKIAIEKLAKFAQNEIDNEFIIKIIPFNALQFETPLPLEDYQLLTITEALQLEKNIVATEIDINAPRPNELHGMKPTAFTPLSQSLRDEITTKYTHITITNNYNKHPFTFFPPQFTTDTPDVTLPFSTLETMVFSKLPTSDTHIDVNIAKDTNYAVLLTNRLQNDKITYQYDLPITHVDDADSISFTSTRLLHNLFGLLSDAWSLIDVNTTTTYLKNTQITNIPAQDAPLLYNGARFVTTTMLQGKNHRSTDPNFSKFWPARTKPSQIAYKWFTLPQLDELLEQNTINPDFYAKLKKLMNYAIDCDLDSTAKQAQQEAEKNASNKADEEEVKSNCGIAIPFGLAALVSIDTVSKAQGSQ